MEQSYNIIVNNGGIFDLQSALGKILKFIWRKYSKDKLMMYNFTKVNQFSFSGYSYLGPYSCLNIRLDEHDQPRPGKEPVSPTHQLALHHDIAYRDAELVETKGLLDLETALQMKHEADKQWYNN